MRTSTAAQEAAWIKNLIWKMGFNREKSTDFLCDNQGAVFVGNNAAYNPRSKRIDLQHHYLRQRVKEGELKLLHCASKHMVADIMTKALPAERLEGLRKKMEI